MPGYESRTTEQILKQEEVNETPLVLRLEAKGQDYTFFAGPDEEHLEVFFEHADGRRNGRHHAWHVRFRKWNRDR